MTLPTSELILNDDGSIYHLGLTPDQLADTVITVGDPDRVDMVTRYFDHIHHQVQRREFRTVTGEYRGKKISVISTGIGTDNIDIVFNELDALVNVDFQTRTIKKSRTNLTIIRLGTSGTIQTDIALDSVLLSEFAIGMDGLGIWYEDEVENNAFAKAIQNTLPPELANYCYPAHADHALLDRFRNQTGWSKGITITCAGFYAPQGRKIRLQPKVEDFIHQMSTVDFHTCGKITNLEMETAGIYLLSGLLGHRALSISAILANRANGQFSSHPEQTVTDMIKKSLEIIAEMQ
jgi:uridine phosphorylase